MEIIQSVIINEQYGTIFTVIYCIGLVVCFALGFTDGHRN